EPARGQHRREGVEVRVPVCGDDFLGAHEVIVPVRRTVVLLRRCRAGEAGLCPAGARATARRGLPGEPPGSPLIAAGADSVGGVTTTRAPPLRSRPARP